MTDRKLNPLLVNSGLPHDAPNFDIIEDAHFLPAFKAAIADYVGKATAVADSTDTPNFTNTIYALELSEVLLNKVSSVFFALSGSDMTDARRAIMDDVLPMLQDANNAVYQNAKLFARVEKVANDPTLDVEQKRLADDYVKGFVEAGIRLTKRQMNTIAKIDAELATLSSKFGQELLKQFDTSALIVNTAEELAGLDAGTIKQLSEAAEKAGHKGKYLVKPSNSTTHPFLESVENRETRQRLYEISINRGEATTNAMGKKILKLRQKKAKLLGFDTWADKQLEPQTAGKVDTVFDFIGQMAPDLKAKTDALAAEMQAIMNAEGVSGKLKPWDWHFYAAKLQQQRGCMDSDALKPYFEFNNVLEKGVFYTMETLYGIKIVERDDIPVYHSDVRAYEIIDTDGRSIAIFYGDFFTRPGKRGGAWKTTYAQQFLENWDTPVVVNVCNIVKADDGEPTLIDLREAQTLFHEFGHALHEIFSRTRYASNSGTRVPRDYVEFPSTYQEDWAQHPDVLKNYAIHHETGEVLSPEMVEKLLESLNFTQAFDTFEYLAATVVDMELHRTKNISTTMDKFERKALKKHGLDSDYILPRYRAGYFSHIFAGGYSATYYAYIWSEILAADAFAYTQELGGLTAAAGKAYRDGILALGNSVDPTEAYKAYRGKAPTADALLKRRGLA